MKRLKVLVSVPHMGWIRTELVQVLCHIGWTQKYEIVFHMPHFVPLENMQAHTIQKIRDEGFDYWLNFDDDTFPMDDVLELLDIAVEKDLDMVGCPYPAWTKDRSTNRSYLHWASYDWDDKMEKHVEHYPHEGLQEVDAVGGGCFIINCRIFENDALQHGAFERMRRDNGTVCLGNDLSFCRRVKAAGYRIWAHYDYRCQHVKETELMSIMLMVSAASQRGTKDGNPIESEEPSVVGSP